MFRAQERPKVRLMAALVFLKHKVLKNIGSFGHKSVAV
jgi:hypothetical protein